jgi:uncharacterized protein (TIGR02001 family)
MQSFLKMALVGFGLVASTPALAQDLSVYAGAALVYAREPDGAGSDDTLAFQPYVEAEINHFYAGLWLSLSSDDVAHEVDLYLGYRNETATGMSYDVGYARYFYPNDGGDCCGELTLSLGLPAGDKLALGIDAAYDPEASVGTASVSGDYSITDRLTLGAAVGVTDNGKEQEWELGTTYSLNDTTAIDLHYYDGSDYPGYMELSVTFDTTLFSR